MISFTDNVMAKALSEEIAVVLGALGIEPLFISDSSLVSDFDLSDEELETTAVCLGIPLLTTDTVVDVALRFRNLRAKQPD